MYYNTSQDLEASSSQEEPKLGKTGGFGIRQMQKGKAQDRQEIYINTGTEDSDLPDDGEFQTAPWIAPWA